MGPSELINTLGQLTLRIREFKDTDTEQVQELERRCDKAAAPAEPGKTSIIFTNLERADPLCRVRSYPIFCMMVAEAQLLPDSDDYSIVGIIRAGIKQVMRPAVHTSAHDDNTRPETIVSSLVGSTYVMAMYISGLRVCCLYRRLGVAQQLVTEVEVWGATHGVEYVYMATENDNQASINLFTHKLGYTRFRSPSILVQPVYSKPRLVHNMRFGASQTCNKSIQIIKLSPVEAGRIYRIALGGSEFFPKDIDAVLRNPLNVGTWVACYRNDINGGEEEKGMYLKDLGGTLDVEHKSGIHSTMLKRVETGTIAWAMLSLWRYDKLIKFEVRGASTRMRRWAALTRLASRMVPWMALPCLPNVFDKAFGVQLIYGLHAYDGRSRHCAPTSGLQYSTAAPPFKHHYHHHHDKCSKVRALLTEKLCWHAHNLALQAGCKAVAVEMSSYDSLITSIPHWPSLSDRDLWCLKRLSVAPSDDLELQGELEDWCKWPPLPFFFLDPRDF